MMTSKLQKAMVWAPFIVDALKQAGIALFGKVAEEFVEWFLKKLRELRDGRAIEYY